MNVFNVCGIVLFLGVVSLSGATITPEERHKTDYTTNWTPNETQTYTVSATASGCSFADSKTQASSGATLSSHSSSGASAEKKVTHNDVPNTSAFSFSVFGVLAGSGKGPEVSWSAALQQKFFWLTPLQKIVAEGTEVTVSANGTPTEATWNIGSREWKDWTVSGGEPYKVSSITLNRNMWDKMQWTPSPVPENWKCPTAGVYHINAATTEESGARSAGATVFVIKIITSATDLFGNVEKDNNGANKMAYVHWNIDNDNNATSSQSGKHPDADYLKTSVVSGENDLKSFSLSLYPMLDKGSVEISIGNNGKIWKSAQKGASSGTDSQLLLAAGTTKIWDLSDSTERNEFNSLGTLFMEGIGSGSETLTIKYKDDKGNEVTSDTINYTFIAANCGNQPLLDYRGSYEQAFPLLERCEWSITGSFSNIYNCIAYSVGETDRHYLPTDMDAVGNNNGIFEESDIIDFYKSKGYKQTTAEFATVMYYSKYHGAKKKSCSCGANQWDMWESKAGMASHVLEHRREQLNGATYGKPILYFKK